MKQYCRYCAFCFEGDCFYCGDHDKVLTEEQIKRVNTCKDFILSGIGDVITGKAYEPRPRKKRYEYYGNLERM